MKLKLSLIAAKARNGEELTEEEIEYVIKALQTFVPIIEATIDWLQPVIAQVIAIWLDALRTLEERMKEEK